MEKAKQSKTLPPVGKRINLTDSELKLRAIEALKNIKKRNCFSKLNVEECIESIKINK